MFPFRSTKQASPEVGFSQAMAQGLAPDGGLYVPVRWPRIELPSIAELEDLPAFAARIIAPYLEGDTLAPHLNEITREVFRFPIPVTELAPEQRVLELFHGPTAAFKDFGAGFLAHGLARAGGRQRILVATSGDTGGAVAAACDRHPELEVLVLYPKGGVSACQELQLTCWGQNIHAFAVRGRFDDCQRMVKQALAQNPWPAVQLTTANSINVGRLVPQIVYHAAGSLRAAEELGAPVELVIPSGNLGNASAALWAKRMGFPIAGITLVSNANRVLFDYFETGEYRARPSIATLANAMDIGDPSNLQRLRDACPGHAQLTQELRSHWVSDERIRSAIHDCQRATGRILDPHTATAVAALESLGAGPKLIVSTAHPAKFAEIVEPLIGTRVPLPPSLQTLGQRPSRKLEIDPDLESLVAAL